MKKIRIYYLIFSIIAIITIVTLMIIYDLYVLGVVLCWLVLGVNPILSMYERNEFKTILINYNNNCNPKNYILALRKFGASCYFTKRRTVAFKLHYCAALLDAGEFDELKKILLMIDEYINELHEISLVLYLRFWSEYFYFSKQPDLMVEILVRLKNVINKSKKSVCKQRYKFLYCQLQARYYILESIEFYKAKEMLKFRRFGNLISTVNCFYDYSLMDIKQKKYEDAIFKLEKIISSGFNLYVVRKSEVLLAQIKE